MDTPPTMIMVKYKPYSEIVLYSKGANFMRTNRKFSSTMRQLVWLGVLMAILVVTSGATQVQDCQLEFVHCVASDLLGVELELSAEIDPSTLHIFIGRLLIFWEDSGCDYKQEVLVIIHDPQAVGNIMQPVGYPSMAMGAIKQTDYQTALFNGWLTELSAGPVNKVCPIPNSSLPPCELPWEPIEVAPISGPDGDITFFSSGQSVPRGPIEPVFCFSYDLERGPIFDFAPDVQVPFFFLTEEGFATFIHDLK